MYLGSTVLYRTVPCPVPTEGQDLNAYSNYKDEDRSGPIWRPAIVIRIWDHTTPYPCINLRVLADSGPEDDLWRSSVPHVTRAVPNGFAWKHLNEPDPE